MKAFAKLKGKNLIMKTPILTVLILIGFGSQMALAHGEDKLGPNNGFIRMPGAFHTEIVPVGSNSLKVYLLDIQWQNPSTKDSALSIKLKSKKYTPAKCSIEADHYICEFPKSVDLTKKGKLTVEAQREKQKGMVVNYELPLKLQVIDDGHGGQ